MGQVVGDVVMMLLQDVNIKKKWIFEIFEFVCGDFYLMIGLGKCVLINSVIGVLIVQFGFDFDLFEECRGLSVGGVVKGVVQSFILFCGVICEVFGVVNVQCEWDVVVDVGIVCCGFLWGIVWLWGCCVIS